MGVTFGPVGLVIADAGGGVNRGQAAAVHGGQIFGPWKINGLRGRVRAVFTTVAARRFLRSLLARGHRRATGGSEAESVMADQVVLAEIAAGFHGDQGDRQAAGVFQPVRLAEGDMDGLALAHQPGAEAEGDTGGARDDDPVFGAVEVGMQRCGLPRSEAEGADAEARTFGENGGREGGLRRCEDDRRFGEALGVRSVHAEVSLFHTSSEPGNGERGVNAGGLFRGISRAQD